MAGNGQTKSAKLSDLLDPQFMARLDAVDVLSRKILAGKLQGERRSKRRGQSVEFADHRPYTSGDDLRLVDWNIYGRLEQLFLKLFMEEQDLTVHIVLDGSASMGTGEPLKEKFAKKTAAALAYVALANNNRLTLSSMGSGGGVRQMAGMRGRRWLPAVAQFLLGTADEGQADFEQACRQLSTGGSTSGIMIIVSDFLFKEGFEGGLRRLAGTNFELYLIQALSPQEIEPQLRGDLRLVDVEDGDIAEVTMSSALIAYYKKNLASYCNELRNWCNRRGAGYTLANSADSVEQLVLNYFRKIRLLG